jgi:hypothetical protein
MNFLKPVLKKSSKAKPTSFGEKRSIQMNQTLVKAQQERKTLLRKEYASPDPLSSAFQQRGNRLDAKINRIKSKTK